MRTKVENGGAAFPTSKLEYFAGEYELNTPQPGMTLRAYIATQAMQAMIAKSSGQDSTGGKNGVPLIAKYAVEYADALISALDAS